VIRRTVMRRPIVLSPATRWNVIAALALAGYASFASAADTRGAIAGRIVDSSGAALQGAQVQVQPRNDLNMASDGQGEFLIPDLAPGDYKVAISYVGFSYYETAAT